MLSVNPGRKILFACCGAHLLQDGLVALQYVLLPILAQTFGLSYAQVGFLRAVNSSAMAVLEIPAGVLAERFGEPRLLIFGLVCAGLGYLGVALTDAFYLVVIGFFIAGAGAAFQHSLASALIAGNFDSANRRRSLGIYNSSGDAGKLVFTGVFSLGLGAGLGWNWIVGLLCLFTFIFAVMLLPLARQQRHVTAADQPADDAAKSSRGWGIRQPGKFAWLGITVFLDSLAQAVFLTFIAFLLLDKGATEGVAAMAVVLALSGGMIGKFLCGFMAARYGDLKTFRILQFFTVAGFIMLPFLPLVAALILLPFIGLAVQGSSTVTYGSVSEFVDRQRQSRGYALIYTLASASAVFGPFLFGYIADIHGLDAAMVALALVTSLTFVTSWVLQKAPPLVRV